MGLAVQGQFANQLILHFTEDPVLVVIYFETEEITKRNYCIKQLLKNISYTNHFLHTLACITSPMQRYQTN